MDDVCVQAGTPLEQHRPVPGAVEVREDPGWVDTGIAGNDKVGDFLTPPTHFGVAVDGGEDDGACLGRREEG